MAKEVKENLTESVVQNASVVVQNLKRKQFFGVKLQ